MSEVVNHGDHTHEVLGGDRLGPPRWLASPPMEWTHTALADALPLPNGWRWSVSADWHPVVAGPTGRLAFYCDDGSLASVGELPESVVDSLRRAEAVRNEGRNGE